VDALRHQIDLAVLQPDLPEMEGEPESDDSRVPQAGFDDDGED
jgi:hypothetical protein